MTKWIEGTKLDSLNFSIEEFSGPVIKSSNSHYHCSFTIGGKKYRTKFNRSNGKDKVSWKDGFLLFEKDLRVKKIKISLMMYKSVLGSFVLDLKKLETGTSKVSSHLIHSVRTNKEIGKIKIKRNRVKRLKIMREQFRFVDYFLISELTVKMNGTKNSNKKTEIKYYRYPEKDHNNICLTSVNEIHLFSIPSYFSYRDYWSPPIVFHFTLSLNNQKVYGTSLIFYRKMEKMNAEKKIYEPIAISILSRVAFLDPFSASLKYIYMNFFHQNELLSSVTKNPPENLVLCFKFFCHEIPVPDSNFNVEVSLKPLSSPFLNVVNFPALRKDPDVDPDFYHPVADSSESGVKIKQTFTAKISQKRVHRPSNAYKIIPKLPEMPSLNTNRSRVILKNLINFGSLVVKAPLLKRSISDPSFSSSRRSSQTCLKPKEVEQRKPFTKERADEIGGHNMDVRMTLRRSSRFHSLPHLSVNLYQNLFNLLDIHTIIKVLSCIMCEINVVFFSSQFSLLTKVQECFKALLFPFNWNHVYVPNLPKQLLHLIEAPVPFMIGLNRMYLNELKKTGIQNKILYVDIDRSSIEYVTQIPIFPSKVKLKIIEKLRRLFKPEIFESDSIFKYPHRKYSDKIQTSIRKCFLQFMYDLLGDYRGYFKFVAGKSPSFNTTKYCRDRDKHSMFFPHFTRTHMFSSFIQEHLRHRAYLADLVEYICHFNREEEEQKIVWACYPRDKENDDAGIIRKKSFIEKINFIEEKSVFEKMRPVEETRISHCLEIFFIKEKTVKNSELASITELFKTFYWRKFFAREIILWIKHPKTKKRYTMTNAEKKRIEWMDNLKKLELKEEIFGDLGFLFHVALSECNKARTEDDYQVAKNLLDASTIFYNTANSNKSGKDDWMEFLIKTLLSHKLMANNDFWKQILVKEIALVFKDKPVNEDWCFKRIIRYAQQMVDLNSMKLKEILECVDFWANYAGLSHENSETLKKAVRNLETSKNIRISEYLNGSYGNLSNLEFIDKMGSLKKELIPDEEDHKLRKERSISFNGKEMESPSKISFGFKKH